jgi:MFS family permease
LQVIGPAVSGMLVAAFGPALVLGLDAASFGVCFLALFGIPIAVPARSRACARPLADLREGWSVFAAHPWLWLSTLQFALFNFLVWAPYLVLGPAVAQLDYGGARAWGVSLGSWGLGAVVGGLLMVRIRDTRRPLIIGIIATSAYALPRRPSPCACRCPRSPHCCWWAVPARRSAECCTRPSSSACCRPTRSPASAPTTTSVPSPSAR